MNVPNTLLSPYTLIFNLIECIYLPHTSKCSLEIVDDGSRRECVGAIGCDAGAEMYIMVYR